MASARVAEGNLLDIHPISRPFSNFDFVEKHFGGLRSLRRVLSQCRQHGAKTMVVEQLDNSPDDIREENEDISKCLPTFDPRESEFFRLSFFSELIEKDQLSHLSSTTFLGFAIIKSDKIPNVRYPRKRIFESVMVTDRNPNICIKRAPKWKCKVGGSTLEISGYLYAQQNGVTNVCAHVALRTAVSCFCRNGDMSYRQMNDLLGIDHLSKKASDGLDANQIITILENAGANCFLADYSQIDSGDLLPPYQKYIYGCIESGYPAILVIRSGNNEHHAITVFGHNFDQNTWVPNAERSYFMVGKDTKYIPSEYWVNAYLAHDDNWGSNFSIPRWYLRTQDKFSGVDSVVRVYPSTCITHVVCTLPRSVKLNPIQAEVIGMDYLSSILPQVPELSDFWIKRLHSSVERGEIVLRPYLVSEKDYAYHLEHISDWEERKIPEELVKKLTTPLKPGHYWMVEISLPELFSANKRKVGEVLLRAETELGTERNMRGFLLARLPRHFAFYAGGTSTKPKYEFIKTGISGHVQLFGCEKGR